MSTQIATMQPRGLDIAFASKYGVEAGKVFAILRETCLKSKETPSDAEVAAFMIVCNQYDLNPFIKEIFGFISKGKMQYVISVDGWSTLVNRQPNLDGIEFAERFGPDGNISAITCKIFRKDRGYPTVITEYFSECRRADSDVWTRWPIRMLRHKAMIQCSRLAFGLAGIMDEDEAERMEGFREPAQRLPEPAKPATTIQAKITAALDPKPARPAEDIQEGDITDDDLPPEMFVEAEPAPQPIGPGVKAQTFFGAWSKRKRDAEKVRKYLKEVHGVDRSFDIREDRFAEALAWAQAPLPDEPEPEMGEDEKWCRAAFAALGMRMLQQMEMSTRAGGDWAKVRIELNRIADEEDTK